MKYLVVLAVCIACGISGFLLIPPYVDRTHNFLYPQSRHLENFSPPKLHADLFVADFHADTLLWNRDLNKKSEYGHLDIPRLALGNIALQGFSIVTKTPRGMKPDNNGGDSDNVTLLALAARWPVRTWASLSERARFQAEQLFHAAEKSGGKFRVIRDRKDLGTYIAARKENPEMTAGFLSVEGSQALEGDLLKLDDLFNAGVRVIAPTHFFDTEYAGSAHGLSHRGLTAEGVKWLAAVEDHHMIVDLAHASDQTISDVLARARRPVVVSHTGVRGICPTNRNLSDEHLRKIAENGGLIGIGFFKEATCGTELEDISRSIAYAVKIAGVSHVTLGSDFDGYVATPIDASQIGALTSELQKAGFDENGIRRIMGENLRDFLLRYLP